MKFDALTEWRNFEAALIQELKATPIAEFEKAWDGRLAKTAFYGSVLLPKIAESLGYKIASEFLRVDFVILNSDQVPVVFIESENNHESGHEEIEKLCAVSAPVRVLFLSCDWVEGEREKWLPGWLDIIATHHKYYGQEAVYMIVVGEWRGTLQYSYYVESFDGSGKEIGRKELSLS